MSNKPLGRKAYGSIGHLPNSRLGPGDHCVDEGMARMCCEPRKNANYRVIVREKLDGSCMAVAKVDGEIIPLMRRGYTALSSPHEQHHLFHDWAIERKSKFDKLLNEGERVVGEWLALAHGTRYELVHDPFVPFDLMTGIVRCIDMEFAGRTAASGFYIIPHLVASCAFPINLAMRAVQCRNASNAIDPVEGVVYQVERGDEVLFLAKYVREDKIDGKYFSENTGMDVWNWRPQ